MSYVSHLKSQGLLPSTRQQYLRIMERVDQNPIDWLHARIHARTPIGTILPLRAAVKHYLIAEQGYTAEELTALLPKAKGRPGKLRDALSPTQLGLYYAAAEQQSEPIRTILLLLPRTGLRISEMCNLSHAEIVGQNQGLRFRGKRDEERYVPLNRTAKKIMERYMVSGFAHGKWVFSGYMGRPLGPAAVRKVTRRIASLHPDLHGLSPHVLRHTFATLALRKGMDLRTLQALMGHKSIETTSRYLHPDTEMLHDAMNLLE